MIYQLQIKIKQEHKEPYWTKANKKYYFDENPWDMIRLKEDIWELVAQWGTSYVRLRLLTDEEEKNLRDSYVKVIATIGVYTNAKE